MRANRKTRSIRNNRKVKSAKSLRGGMRLKRRSLRKTQSARKTRNLRKSKTYRKSKSSRKTRRRRNMKGGYIEYSALPCFESAGEHINPETGKEVRHHKHETNWNSSKQVGPESCIEYNFEGAEKDPKAASFGFDLDGLAYETTTGGLGREEIKELFEKLLDARMSNNPNFESEGYMNHPRYKELYEAAKDKPNDSPEYKELIDWIQGYFIEFDNATNQGANPAPANNTNNSAPANNTNNSASANNTNNSASANNTNNSAVANNTNNTNNTAAATNNGTTAASNNQ